VLRVPVHGIEARDALCGLRPKLVFRERAETARTKNRLGILAGDARHHQAVEHRRLGGLRDDRSHM